jgi:hypothetical protein
MKIKVRFILAVTIALGPLCVVPSIARCWPGSGLDQGRTNAPGEAAANTIPAVLDPSVKRTYVPFGLGVYGLLYEPATPGEKSHVGIFIMHYLADYTNFPACTELSKRGYTVLCAKNSGGNLDRILLDAKSGVSYLRNYPGIRKVILFGHAGGASLLTAYQLIAENGVKVCQDSEKIIKCPDSLAGLPQADGMVLADTELGVAESMLTSIDPAVVDEGSGMKINPDLDAFNSKNGFNPNGSSNYSKAFLDKYQRAVAKRNNQLIDAALARLAAIEAGKGRYADDEPFTVPGAGSTIPNHKLYPNDTNLMSHTKDAWPLLHADGSVTREIVHSVRIPEIRSSFTSSLDIGAVNTTVRSFLIDHAIRVSDDYGIDEDSIHGVLWRSSYSSAVGNVEGITVPLLIMGMTGNSAYLAGEITYEHAKSPDKTLTFVEGASHTYETCKQCEKYPGQFGDTMKIVFDRIDSWLNQSGRFTAGQP